MRVNVREQRPFVNISMPNEKELMNLLHEAEQLAEALNETLAKIRAFQIDVKVS